MSSNWNGESELANISFMLEELVLNGSKNNHSFLGLSKTYELRTFMEIING